MSKKKIIIICIVVFSLLIGAFICWKFIIVPKKGVNSVSHIDRVEENRKKQKEKDASDDDWKNNPNIRELEKSDAAATARGANSNGVATITQMPDQIGWLINIVDKVNSNASSDMRDVPLMKAEVYYDNESANWVILSYKNGKQFLVSMHLIGPDMIEYIYDCQIKSNADIAKFINLNKCTKVKINYKKAIADMYGDAWVDKIEDLR